MKKEVIKNFIKICNKHIKKYKQRKISLKELDRLCGIYSKNKKIISRGTDNI
jgi:hypothetical protein